MEEPTVEAPTCVFGLLGAGEVRYEALKGDGDTVDAWSQRFSRPHIIRNDKPWQVENSPMWSLSHMQKDTYWGFLIFKPFCFHAWAFIQKQRKCPHGAWVDGSEFGKYIRIGLWRFDLKGTIDKVTGQLKHWIGPVTIYFNFSFHFD